MIDKCDIDKLREGTTLIYNPVNNLELNINGTGFGIKLGAKAKITEYSSSEITNESVYIVQNTAFGTGTLLKFEFAEFLTYVLRLPNEFVYENFDIL